MGPPFVPALDFLGNLVTLVLDAASSHAAVTAKGPASAADDAEMEAYAAAAGGGGSSEADGVARKRPRTGL
jgi:hypothetical protein